MRPTRIERATYGFEVRYSIQLSYERIWFVALGLRLERIGCLMGLEPTTIRSTIWRSTTELQAPCNWCLILYQKGLKYVKRLKRKFSIFFVFFRRKKIVGALRGCVRKLLASKLTRRVFSFCERFSTPVERGAANIVDAWGEASPFYIEFPKLRFL